MTLAELVVAVGLMTMLLLASIQLFTHLLASGGKTTASMVAMNLATSKLEEEISGSNPGNGGVIAAYTLDPASNTQFYYQVTRAPMSGDPNAPKGAYLGGFTVTIQVWWNTDSPSRARPGVGLQQVRLSRFVYTRTSVP
jgi:type II secretory pathway pseudopilin PulG